MTVEILISALAKGATGKFAPYPMNTILGYLIDQVSAQEVKLASFELKLDQHMTNPFRVGKVYLKEARNAPDRNRQREHLNRALEEFIRLIFDGVEWLDQGLIHRKRAKALEESAKRLAPIVTETREFRKSLSALLASRRSPGLPR